MTAKEYLRNIRDEQKEIRMLKNKRDGIILNSAKPAGIRYDKVRVQSSPKDPMEVFEHWSELQEEIDEHIDKLQKNRAEAIRLIRKINQSTYRQILMLYYLTPKSDHEMMSWHDVATEMKYSDDRIWHLHGYALQEFSRIYAKKNKNKRRQKKAD